MRGTQTNNKMKNQNQKITISNITYVIEQTQTPAQHRADGRPNVAASREENKIIADLVVRRPNGSKLHLVYALANGGMVYVCGF